MISPINERAEEVTIRHEYKSNQHGFTKIEVEVVFSFKYMKVNDDGSLSPRWSSRTYHVTPTSLMRILRYIGDANTVEQYVHGDDFQFIHEITYQRI